MNSFYIALAVGFGGFFGAISRFYLSAFVNKNFAFSSSNFLFSLPIGTLFVNLIGSFLIGILFSFLSSNENISEYFKLIIITGFLGALTTYSTFAYESLVLLQNEKYLTAFLNIGFNAFGTVLAVALGFYLYKIVS